MQVFLSEPNLLDSVRVLDNVRLNKQLVEGNQILNAILQTPEGGGQRVNGKVPFASNHPVTNMWRGHEGALICYLWQCKYELDDYRDYDTKKNTANLNRLAENFNTAIPRVLPAWYKDPVQRDKVMLTHRANLYNKDPEWYADYRVDALILDKYLDRWVCCPDKVRKDKHKPYYYPTHVEA